MKSTAPTLLIILVVAIATGGCLGSSNRNVGLPNRPIYGKASLSEEEKRILYKPFPDCSKHNYSKKAYAVAVICMKHRLSRNEIRELIEGPQSEVDKTEPTFLAYVFGGGRFIEFHFGPNGNLTEVFGVTGLPSLESVTSDTSIEPPP